MANGFNYVPCHQRQEGPDSSLLGLTAQRLPQPQSLIHLSAATLISSCTSNTVFRRIEHTATLAVANPILTLLLQYSRDCCVKPVGGTKSADSHLPCVRQRRRYDKDRRCYLFVALPPPPPPLLPHSSESLVNFDSGKKIAKRFDNKRLALAQKRKKMKFTEYRRKLRHAQLEEETRKIEAEGKTYGAVAFCHLPFMEMTVPPTPGPVGVMLRFLEGGDNRRSSSFISVTGVARCTGFVTHSPLATRPSSLSVIYIIGSLRPANRSRLQMWRKHRVLAFRCG
ncbi:hypothetical protein J6590_074555 [Homalodisca vitripennis]|nr:hypothetical protein J6590_074555 [Homalodisca vitripennis]